ncbi:hypothetical protein FRC01_003694 [Tulasnella sp. 417]|nr:hypothetical protein FRC01_003694 [Tulasnella sp. 417]
MAKSKRSIRWMSVVIRRRKEELQEFLGWASTSIHSDEDELSRPSSMHVALSDDRRRTAHSIQNRAVPRLPALTPVGKFVKERVATPIGSYIHHLIRVFHSDGNDSAGRIEVKDRQQQIVNAQAANWLLEMTSSLEDQLTVAQNICCIDPTVCDLLSLYPGIGGRLLSLTVDAVCACQNQSSDRNISIAEQFGTAFYHVMLCYPRNHELWNLLGQKLPIDSFRSRGTPILSELSSVLRGTELPFFFFRPEASHFFRKVLLHNMIVSFDDRWRLEGQPMLLANYDDAVLSLLALHISLRIGKSAASIDIRIGQNLQNLATQAYAGLRANLERNLADALPALVSSIVSRISHDSYDKRNAAFICSAFLERIKFAIDRRALSPLLQETLSSCLPQLLSGFGTLEDQDLYVVQLSTVALGCFRALERLTLPSYDDTTLETIYNALQYGVVAADRNPKLADLISLDDYLLESLEWIDNNGPVNLQRGMGKYPRIISRIAANLKACPETKRRRWMETIHKNRYQLIQKQNLSVWEDAELGAHAVSYLRGAESPPHLIRATNIIRLWLSFSVVHSTGLLAAEIVDAIAEVSKAIIGWPKFFQNYRKTMYMQLVDVILQVWGATSLLARSIHWPTDCTIHALSILMPYVHKFEAILQDVADGKVVGNNLEALPLLVDYLRKRKPEAAFLARNLDVSINRLFDTPETRFQWNYPLHIDQGASTPCSRLSYIGSGLLQ